MADEKKKEWHYEPPLTVIDWELKHGIGRYERGGCVYVYCHDFKAFCAQCEKRTRNDCKRR